MTYSSIVEDVISSEISCLQHFRDSLDERIEGFVSELDRCKGLIILSGIGKSGHICKKIIATMQSLGIKSAFLHPAEALHGDLGVVSKGDIVVLVSNSGETREILDTIPPLEAIGARIFSIVGKHDSTLEKKSEMTIVMNGIEEVYLDMVPTSSTTATLALGDGIAVSIATSRGFSKEQFGVLHPSGQLGKRLTLRVCDIMVQGEENPTVIEGSPLSQVVFEMCRKPTGCVSIVDADGQLMGLFTDGDLRRFLDTNLEGMQNVIIDGIMIRNPVVVGEKDLVYSVIEDVIKKHHKSVYPVVDDGGKAVGVLRLIDIIKSGLVS